jgi:hypothetical protein
MSAWFIPTPLPASTWGYTIDKMARQTAVPSSEMTPRPSTPPSIAAAVGDAAWLAHRYDPERDAVHLLPVSRDLHRKAIFLTDEYLPRNLQPLIVARTDAIAAIESQAPIHFVFHSAYCCSTLVARAFDRPGWAMGLKEPVILNDIVGWRRRGEPGPDMATVLDDALRLLSRPFSPNEAVIVKPSNIVNCLAPAMLALRPEAKALLLYAPLRTYLSSIAKKGIDGRLWVRTLLLGLIDDKMVDMGFTPRDHLGQTDLQVAAIGWLAQHALFAKLVQQFGTNRVRTLDSATLITDPANAMKQLSQLFGLPVDAKELNEITNGRAFKRHSKLDTDFGAEDRDREHGFATEIHADEIEKVAHWAEVVASTFQIAINPPAALISGSAK